ncbi:MAG TPA: hypothetical protein VG890_10565 [Puia sp.]|nr:hypothetical protein [Puia sp.]
MLLSSIIIHSVNRDIMLVRQYPSDLRNRVVGARLQKDGKLPYFYYWRPRDGERYADPNNQNQGPKTINNITASPFFHELLMPVCDLPQKTLAGLWTMLQYLLQAGITLLLCSLTKEQDKKWLLVNISVLFTITQAWICLISGGQLYLFEGFLMSCIIFGVLRNHKPAIVFAGVCAAMLVLTRPIAIIIFISFVLKYKKNLLWLFSAFAVLMLYWTFVLSSTFETSLWKQYAAALKMHVQLHQSDDPDLEAKRTFPVNVSDIEGYDFDEVKRLNIAYPIPVYSECGNFFYLYNITTGRKMPLSVLNSLLLISLILLSTLFYFSYRKNAPDPMQILIFALTLYMLVEMFSPIHRHQYNTTQWFPIVLSGFLFLHHRPWLFSLLASGLVLNIGCITWLPMRHTIGELIWMAGSLLIALIPSENQFQWRSQ